MTRKSLQTLALIMTCLYIPLLGFSIIPAVFSIMLGDGGSSTRIYIQIFSLLTLPVVLILSLIFSWVFFGLKMTKTTIVLLFIPFINLGLILFYILIPEWLA